MIDEEVARVLQTDLTQLDLKSNARVRAPTPGDDPSTDGNDSYENDDDDDYMSDSYLPWEDFPLQKKAALHDVRIAFERLISTERAALIKVGKPDLFVQDLLTEQHLKCWHVCNRVGVKPIMVVFTKDDKVAFQTYPGEKFRFPGAGKISDGTLCPTTTAKCLFRDILHGGACACLAEDEKV